jgi:hypothetical protein
LSARLNLSTSFDVDLTGKGMPDLINLSIEEAIEPKNVTTAS